MGFLTFITRETIMVKFNHHLQVTTLNIRSQLQIFVLTYLNRGKWEAIEMHCNGGCLQRTGFRILYKYFLFFINSWIMKYFKNFTFTLIKAVNEISTGTDRVWGWLRNFPNVSISVNENSANLNLISFLAFI